MDSLARNSTLWNFIKNPGLQHLAKEIFWNLNYSSLEICQQINQSSSQILENPFFWLEKFIRAGSISKKNQEDWTKVIQSVINTNMEKHIVLYLKWTLKEKGAVDVTIYTNPIVQDEFNEKIYWAARNGHTEIVKVLAPLSDNPNEPKIQGCTPINVAARNGHTKIVKILASLTDNPNVADKNGNTPISSAAIYG